MDKRYVVSENVNKEKSNSFKIVLFVILLLIISYFSLYYVFKDVEFNVGYKEEIVSSEYNYEDKAIVEKKERIDSIKEIDNEQKVSRDNVKNEGFFKPSIAYYKENNNMIEIHFLKSQHTFSYISNFKIRLLEKDEICVLAFSNIGIDEYDREIYTFSFVCPYSSNEILGNKNFEYDAILNSKNLTLREVGQFNVDVVRKSNIN